MNVSKQNIWAALLCLAAGNAVAQGGPVLQDPGQKSVRVVRTTTPPVIDGDLERCGVGRRPRSSTTCTR